MNDDPLHDLRDLLLRRRLSPEEQRRAQEWLRTHPETAAAWREDAALAEALRRLETPRISSNFTARVMADIRRDESRDASRPSPAPRAWWRRWVPVAASLAVMLTGVASWRIQVARSDAEYARHVAALRAMATLPSGALEDFDAIQRFGDTPPPVDYELLAALQ